MEISATERLEFLKIVEDIGDNGLLYIFGAGKYGKIFGEFFNQSNVKWCGYLDNDSSLWGKKLKGKEVYQPEKIGNTDIYVLVAFSKSIYLEQYFDILDQIKNNGVDQEKILVFGNNFNALTADIIWYIKKPDKYICKVRQIEGICAGKRCFIIGNGPSLRIEDLEKLRNDFTMGCNGIIQLYEKTRWRPSCYFFGDPFFLKKYARTFDELKSILSQCDIGVTNISNDVYDRYRDEFDNLYFLYEKKEIRFSEKIEKEIYTWGSSIFGMIQIAIYMGIKEIYLLGVDHVFRKEMKNGKVIINEGIKNHMELMDQTNQGMYQIDIITQEFQVAKEYADAHMIKIYNATRGGELEVFERVNFDNLF